MQFLDVDLPSITHFKAGVISASAAMQAALAAAPAGSAVDIDEGTAEAGASVVGADYALTSCDLTDAAAVETLLKGCALSPKYVPHQPTPCPTGTPNHTVHTDCLHWSSPSVFLSTFPAMTPSG